MTPKSRPARLAVVAAGIIAGQLVLYGSCLLGWKILLPLDILAQGNVYIPRTEGMRKIAPHDTMPSDLVFSVEPLRQFTGEQLGAGRLPFWCPNMYGGAPSYRMSFSPPVLPAYFIRSPVVLAYTQMLNALVAGAGAYVLLTRVVKVGFWPAAVGAWCYPISGAFILWTGMGPLPVLCWLCWTLVAVDATIGHPRGWGGPLLAVITFIALIAGQADVAGQILLSSGLFATWRLFDRFGKNLFSRQTVAPAGAVVLGWGLGILLAAWLLIPLVQYTRTGARIAERARGMEERPPAGIVELPRVLVPEFYGNSVGGSHLIKSGALPESAAGAYAGLLAALLLAPLAWCSQRHRSINVFWVVLGLLGLCWQLNVPGIVWLLRLHGLNLMSHNRWVFATGLSILCLAATGLEVLITGSIGRRRWFAIPLLCLIGFGGWCAYSAFDLPEPIATQLPRVLAKRTTGPPATDAEIAEIQARFERCYSTAAALCLVGAAVIATIWIRGQAGRWMAPVLAGLMIAELLWFGFGETAQCDPALYYPRIPVLDELARIGDGRVVGFLCLPANLAQMAGLRDIRGYDSVDPSRLIDLLKIAAVPRTMLNSYALSQWMAPSIGYNDSGQIRLSPVLDMLNVRYVIFRYTPDFFFRGVPPSQRPNLAPMLAGFDYWVLKNDRALPRAFVPQRIETIPDDATRLQRLADPNFSPAQVAYVETNVDAPNQCQGVARITTDLPNEVVVSAVMRTAGIVVLADLWDSGWHAYVDGKETAILRVDHAIRGVSVPEGNSTIDFRYQPAGLRVGALISCIALLALIAWAACLNR